MNRAGLVLIARCLFVSLSPAQISLVEAFPNLRFDLPVDFQSPRDGSHRLFVVEQEGRIRVFENHPGVSETRLFLDLTDSVSYENGSELGLLGLAFHPGYASNGFFFINYTAANPLRSIIARFRVTTDPDSADLTSEVRLIEIPQPYTNHNGGQLAFGPDGMLYIALGDGGNAGDPLGNAQSTATLLGKILRIDVDAPDPGLAYGIPSDNPFANAQSGREIFAYGLRNPWRFSFDPATGLLWCGDVGQGAREEINIIESGKNYGWNIMEGSICYNAASCDQTGLTPPVWDYGRTIGGAITGGYVYRGPSVGSLTGKYVFGDFVSGIVAALAYDGTIASVEYLDTLPRFSLSSFGLDEEGEVYACAFDGVIYRFTSPVTSVGRQEETIPQGFALRQNYPNPFNAVTHIRFSLPSSGHVSFSVFDMRGVRVARLFEGTLMGGSHALPWEPGNLSTGVYFGQLEFSAVGHVFIQSRRMLLLR